MNKFLLWMAQGFGAGRIPIAPGTFGSGVGLLWFALLLLAGNFWLFLFGTMLGIGFSVWLCGVGETVLRRKDPGSIVFDEIAAMPLCFAGWVAMIVWNTGSFPTPDIFFIKPNLLMTLAVFSAFRFFDVVKPWPVRQSQALIGGWGVTMDDVLAAGYVNLAVLAFYIARSAFA